MSHLKIFFLLTILFYYCQSAPVQFETYQNEYQGGFGDEHMGRREFAESHYARSSLSDDDDHLSHEDHPEHGPYEEGDIIAYPTVDARSGIVSDHYRWPNGIVPFFIDPEFDSSQVQLIKKAMGEIELKTCIRFKEVLAHTTQNHIRFFKWKGSKFCATSVGMQGGEQLVKLGDNCFLVGRGTVLHEILHTIGLFHEHVREDRDNHIKVHYDKIRVDKRGFLDRRHTQTFGIPYDLGSIMHSSRIVYPIIPNTVTIEPHDSHVQIGQREAMTESDASVIDFMYQGVCPIGR